jgi:hypothetical protein
LTANVLAFSIGQYVQKPWANAHPGEKGDNSGGEFKRRRVRDKLHGWLLDWLNDLMFVICSNTCAYVTQHCAE